MNYSEIYNDLVIKADGYSEGYNLDGLSNILMEFANLGASISEPMLEAQIAGNRDVYRAYQRLDKDIGRKMNAIRSRLSALKVERENL